jgi:drug/metabolite transporter (DMT)-like permease
MTMNNDESLKGYLIIIIGVFTWSFSEIIVKLLQGSVGAISLSFFRYFIGGLFLLFILVIKRDLSGIILINKNPRIEENI